MISIMRGVRIYRGAIRWSLLLKPVFSMTKESVKFKAGIVMLVPVLILGLLSIFSPIYYKSWYFFPKDLPPSLSSVDLFLGTTSNGRSVFWATSNAILNSLVIAILTTLIASHLGLFIGIIAGYRGGLIDRTLMFITDSFVVIPSLPLLIILSMLLKEYLTLPLLSILISITSWPWPARQVRAIVVSLREREYIPIAMLSGLSHSKIVFKEIMPHLIGWHLINATNTVLYAIGSEVGLSILGLSILSEDTLGTMIYWSILGYGALFRGIWWWAAPPIIITIIIFTALYLISTSIAEKIEPKLRWIR